MNYKQPNTRASGKTTNFFLNYVSLASVSEWLKHVVEESGHVVRRLVAVPSVRVHLLFLLLPVFPPLAPSCCDSCIGLDLLPAPACSNIEGKTAQGPAETGRGGT